MLPGGRARWRCSRRSREETSGSPWLGAADPDAASGSTDGKHPSRSHSNRGATVTNVFHAPGTFDEKRQDCSSVFAPDGEDDPSVIDKHRSYLPQPRFQP